MKTRKQIIGVVLLLNGFAAVVRGDIHSGMSRDQQTSLFNALDLSPPALAPVRQAVAAGDYLKAEHEWAEYLRHRSSVRWDFDVRNAENKVDTSLKRANDAAAGRVVGGLVPIAHDFPDNKIDWFFNPTAHNPAEPLNPEWQWQLCRMAFWRDLGYAYRTRHDEKFADAWVRQFRSFAEECPAPSSRQNTGVSAWRTIECGIRMRSSWHDAFFSFLASPKFTDDDISLYSLLCLQHARYLKQNLTSGNFLTMEMSGLYTIGCVFPEFRDATDWRTFAADRLRAEEQVQFLPDDAHYELSPGYHNVALDNFLSVVERAKTQGRLSELPAGYIAGLEHAMDYDLYLMTPDRSLPRFNDSWPVDVVQWMQTALTYFPDRADYRFIATDGREGTAPTTTSHEFSWAGFYAMRSGWGRGDNLAVFRAGPLGYGHMHQDKLNVVFWPWGRDLLYDSGGGSYEQSPYRVYATSTFSHNTVIVDGKGQARSQVDRVTCVPQAAMDGHWKSTPTFDFAAAAYKDGYGTQDNKIATHTRRVLFLKPDLLLVADTLQPNDSAVHTYEARWNLLTTHTAADERLHSVTTTDAQVPNLTVLPLVSDGMQVTVASAQTQPELLGWNVRKDLHPEYVPATTVVHSRHAAGTQQFLTLMIPLQPGESNPVADVVGTEAAGLTVHFTNGRQLTLTLSADPASEIRWTQSAPGGAAPQHGAVSIEK